MEDKILTQNKIPGCNQLTRPEEIKALSKYLKNIRKTQEDHTHLENNNIEVPGRTTGKLKTINSLENHIEGLDRVEGINNLYSEESRISIDGNSIKNEDELYTVNSRESLSIQNDNVHLNNSKETLKIESDVEINSYQDKLDIKSDNESLLNKKEKISLDNIESTDNLYTKKEILEVNNKESILPDKKENLVDKREIELESSKIIIDKKDQKDLSSVKIDLESNNDNPSLSTTKDTLIINNDSDLSSHRENLNLGKDFNDLDNTKINIEVPDKLKNLGNDIINLVKDNKDSELLNYKEILNTDEEIGELPSDKEKIEEAEFNGNLSTTIKNLNNTENKVTSLSKESINLNNTDNSSPESLSNYRDDLNNIDLNNSLEDHREDILTEDNNSLTNHKEELSINKDNISLEDYKEKLLAENNNSLVDHKETLTINKDNSLNNFKELLEVDDNNSLNNYKESLAVDDNDLLENYKELLKINNDELTLEDYLDSLEGLDNYEVTNLEQHIERLDKTIVSELSKESIKIPEVNENEFEGYNPLDEEQLNSFEGELTNFYDSILEVPEVESAPRIDGDYNHFNPDNIDSENIYDSVLEIPEINESHIIEELNNNDKAEIPEKNKISNIENLNEDYYISLPKETKDISDLNKNKKETLNSSNGPGNYKYSKDINSLPTKSIEGLDMKLPEFGLDSLNTNNYLRWTAEKAIQGTKLHGESKQLLIDETLAGLVVARDELEKLTKSNRYRLPGNDGGVLGDLVSSGASGVLSNIGNRLGNAVNTAIGSKSVDISNPLNRPKKKKFKIKETSEFDNANNRLTSSNPEGLISSNSVFSAKEKELLTKIVNEGTKASEKKKGNKFWKKLGKAIKNLAIGGNSGNGGYNFKSNYISGSGILTTLMDLCGVSEEDNKVETLEGLQNLLKSSPYISTPDKFTSTGYSSNRIQTLDSNAYWEVILEPYAGTENGNLNYLPGIHEINVRNIKKYGVNTAYNKWIPFTGFDLQKAKMTSKTLNLYDGEISYPISMEFTNELRITIADDQYKSWRTYFEECSKAAIYNSEGHSKEYYNPSQDKEIEEMTLTAIDTNNICVAMYKNICFRCRIYVLTPQYSTIRKFDLLIVMKDFSEEYTGDMGDGAGDITVSFSVVGENPKDNPPKAITINNEPAKKKKGIDYGSIVESGVNSVIGLIK